MTSDSVHQGSRRKGANIDIWLVMVIVVLVFTFGGGLWLTGHSIMIRFDEMDQKLTGRTSDLQSEVFALRKDLQDVRSVLAAQDSATRRAPVAAVVAPSGAGARPAR